jgi:hypothetical protein
MAEVIILERTKVLTADRARLGKYDLWITYQVDKARQDLVIIPEEGWTMEKIQAAIKKHEADRASTVGKSFIV